MKERFDALIQNNFYEISSMLGTISLIAVFALNLHRSAIEVYLQDVRNCRGIGIAFILLGVFALYLFLHCPIKLAPVVDVSSYTSTVALILIGIAMTVAVEITEIEFTYIILSSVCLILEGTAFIVICTLKNSGY